MADSDDDLLKQIEEAIDAMKEEHQIANQELFQSILSLVEKHKEERIKLEVRVQYLLQQFARELDMNEETFGEIINSVHDFVENNWEELKKEIHNVDSLRRQIDTISREKFQKDMDDGLTEEDEKGKEDDKQDDEDDEEKEL